MVNDTPLLVQSFGVGVPTDLVSLEAIMIDISQWRSSIGSWYYRQITSFIHCSKSSTTSDVPTGNNRIVGVTQTKRVKLIRSLGFSVVCGLLLLLIISGDIELNPGPITELTSSNVLRLLVRSGFVVKQKWTELISLLGVSLDERMRLKTMAHTDNDYHFALEEGLQWWINNCSTASWEELISAVENCENCANIASVIRKEIGIVNQKSREVLRAHSSHLIDVLSTTPNRVTNALYAENLIPFEVKSNLISLTEDYNKASKLVLVLERQLQTHSNPDQYLHDICRVLIHQQHQILTDIATSILKQLGQSITEDVISISPLDPDVQQYCDIMKDKYKHQPIVPTDWPPRVGQDFFGRLALLQAKDKHADPETIQQTAWCVLRGYIDEIPYFTKNKIGMIDIDDILKPNESSWSLTTVIDGPPGIGKTTLCRKLLNMWANGQMKHGLYDLVMYCPLRYDKVAQACTLSDLFVYQSPKVLKVVEWIAMTEGNRVLIIFDGWDELSFELRQSSLATKIIRKELLDKCSIIVTSRSYASSSLLDLDSINRHVEVMGFTVKEIKNVVDGTLEKEPHIAKKLIQDLKVRGDVLSLCYIPLVCSIVILVYRKAFGQLPTTLTELYENFILQTIRRHIKKNTESYDDIEPEDILSLDEKDLPRDLVHDFKDICKSAYLSLEDHKMAFSSSDLQQRQRLKWSGYLGLITKCDEDSYQFLHLTIQEFLAAWWIAKYEKTEQVFNDRFSNDHFRMCLRFVAGLTHLEHEDYQQYFNKEVDLQCKRIPQFGLEACYYSRFQQHPEIKMQQQTNSFLGSNHCYSHYFEKLDILLLQLLYESQNTTLCRVLAQSMKNHSLCLHDARLSLFDVLCFSYFINNSNTMWNHLDLSHLNDGRIQILTNTLTTTTSQQNDCKRIELVLLEVNERVSVYKLLKLPFLHNIQECYYSSCNIPLHLCLVMLELLNLPQLKVLHLVKSDIGLYESTSSILSTDKHSELEECIAINSTVLELSVQCKNNSFGERNISRTITSLINGVAGNKTISSFSLVVTHEIPPLSDGTVEHLLEDNHTLQNLKLDIPDKTIPSSVNIVKVNTPLTTLEIGLYVATSTLRNVPRNRHKLSISLLPHIKGLKVFHPYQPEHLFHSHPNLQHLNLQLNSSKSVIELFTILQRNTTLKALRVEMWNTNFTDSMGTSLQDMLTLNQTIGWM